MLMQFLLVCAGGGLGSGARYLVINVTNRVAVGANFPWATWLVNVSGCFAIGALAGWSESRGMRPELILFFATGLLGGFTTFSTCIIDVLVLNDTGRVGLAFLALSTQVIAGLAFAAMGRAIIK